MLSASCGRYGAKRLGACSQASMSIERHSGFCFTKISITQTRLYRRPCDVKGEEGKPYYIITQLAGKACMGQGRQRHILNTGDMMLIDGAQPSEFIYDTSSSQLSMAMPREFFASPRFYGSINCGTKIPADSRVARMARRLVDEAASLPNLSHVESEAIMGAVVNLIAPLVFSQSVSQSSQQKAYIRAIQFIETNLQEPDLDPAGIAKAVGVSVRTLYRCFAENDIVVAQYIRDRRLDVCAEIIRRQGRVSLTALALNWGFNNSGQFSAAFKAKFHMTPTEYRQRYSRGFA